MANQFVTITCRSPRLSVRALMDEDAPTISAGYGGFEETQRPGRRSLVTWNGAAAYRMTLALVLEGWPHTSVQAPCSALERMASMVAAFQAPPKIRVSGSAVPKAGLDWRIDELAWGEALRTSAGMLVRQRVALTLVQAVDEGTGVRVSTAATRRLSGRSVMLAAPGGAVALQRLAARELGAAKRWKEIARINAIRDPKKVRAGALLRLP